MSFFSIDGPFQRYGTIVFDLILLNFYWLLLTALSFGLLAGPASVALYTSVNTCIRESSGHVSKTFFSTFKNKFKISIIGGILALILLLVDGYAIYLISLEIMPEWMFIIYFAIGLYIIMLIPYYMAMASHTDFNFKKLMKYSLIFALKHLPTTIIILVVNIFVAFAVYFGFTYVVLIIVGPAFLLTSYLISGRLLKQYDLDLLE